MFKHSLSLLLIVFALGLSACSSSAVPDDVLQQAVAKKYMPMWTWYKDQEITILNEYEQTKKGEVFTVIEYELTFRISDEEVAKLKAAGYTEFWNLPFDAARKRDGRFFFIKRGEKWYSKHRKLK